MRTLVCEFIRCFHNTEVNNGSPGREYHYAYFGDKTLLTGDEIYAVVHNGTDFGIVRVNRVLPGLHPKVTKSVMLVFTKDDFEAYKELNKNLKQRRQDYAMLDDMLEQQKLLDKYDVLKDNPEAQEVLDRIRGKAPQQDTLTSAASSEAVGG